MVVADSVRPAAVVEALRELHSLTGGTDGARRLAWSEDWRSARSWYRGHLAGFGVEMSEDAAGNAWATVPGRSSEALIIGGHLDSVPGGGWLDGSLGVLAGAEVLRAFAAGPPPPLTVRVVDWADEEGVRFGRSLVGSSAAAERLDLDEFRRLRDADGRGPDAILGEHGIDAAKLLDASAELADAGAYLELHIEQGPVLEEMGLPLAAVLGTCGIDRSVAVLSGQAAHAGSTPMATRRDAFLAAARIALALRDAAIAVGAMATMGRCALTPNAVTVIPGACELSVDLRHFDASELRGLAERARKIAFGIAEEEGVEVEWRSIWQIDPVRFDDELVAIVHRAAGEVSGSNHRMPSGALHDAAEVAQAGVPTAMLFVQSLGGLSHTVKEDTSPADLELAVRALALACERVVERGPAARA